MHTKEILIGSHLCIGSMKLICFEGGSLELKVREAGEEGFEEEEGGS